MPTNCKALLGVLAAIALLQGGNNTTTAAAPRTDLLRVRFMSLLSPVASLR